MATGSIIPKLRYNHFVYVKLSRSRKGWGWLTALPGLGQIFHGLPSLSMADFPQPGLPSDCERAGTALCVVALHALSKSGGSILTHLLVRGKHLSSLTVFSQASPCGPLAQNWLSFSLSTIIMVTIVTNGGQTRITHNSCSTGSRKLLKRTS